MCFWERQKRKSKIIKKNRTKQKTYEDKHEWQTDEGKVKRKHAVHRMAKILPAAKCEAFTPSFHTKVFLKVYMYCEIHIVSVFNQTLTCKCLLFTRLSTRVRYGFSEIFCLGDKGASATAHMKTH